MRKHLRDFIASDDGAVTVDWVVLTAAIVGLGFAVIGVFYSGNMTLADSVSDAVSNTQVGLDSYNN